MNLFQISEEYMGILAMLEETGGELTPELEDAMAVNREDLENKLNAYAYMVRQKEGDIALIDDEIKRLKALKEASANIVSRLKETIVGALKLYDLRGKSGNYALKLPFHNMYTRRTQAVAINEEALRSIAVPEWEDYVKVAVNRKLNAEEYSMVVLNIVESGGNVEDSDFTIIPIKDAIKSAINEGVDIPFASILESDSLTIR